ncbi:MAG TPA: hypothetical protein VMV92_11555 [Streptosporangiaceae bacterium]|nr:hypothetical protein [Streptosporangiaceae bacterium]
MSLSVWYPFVGQSRGSARLTATEAVGVAVSASDPPAPKRSARLQIAGRQSEGQAAPSWAWLIHLASLALSGLYILVADRRMWFWFDDWDFVQDRGLVHSRLGLWAPHNDHWSTLPILAYRALLTQFGMRSYLPFLVLLVAAHLALAHVLWRMSLRGGADPVIATVLVGVFAVLGAGWQNLGWAFQIGFVGSVLFGWLWLWATDHDGGFGGRDVGGWALGLVSVMCSGIGVPMLMVVAIAVSLRRGIRQAAAAVSVPVVAFLVWYELYGRLARRSAPIDRNTLFQIGAYAWGGIENAFSSSVGFTGAGAVLAVALVYGLLRRPVCVSPSDAVARAGAVGVVLTYLFIGIGRSGLGNLQADRTRYVYIAIALVLPAAALLLSGLFRPTAGRTLVFLLLCSVILVINANDLRVAESNYAAQADAAKQQILGSYDLANGTGYVFEGAPTVSYAGPQPSVSGLRQFRRSGWLNRSYHVPRGVLLGDQARMQVGALPAGAAAPATVPATIVSTAGLSMVAVGPGCVAVTPTGSRPRLTFGPSGTPLLLTMTRSSPAKLTGALELPASRVHAHFAPISLNGDTRILLAAQGVRAALGLPAHGATKICGLAVGRHGRHSGSAQRPWPGPDSMRMLTLRPA